MLKTKIDKEIYTQVRECYRLIIDDMIEDCGKLVYEIRTIGDFTERISSYDENSWVDAAQRAQEEFETNFEEYDRWLDPHLPEYDEQKQILIDYVKSL